MDPQRSTDPILERPQSARGAAVAFDLIRRHHFSPFKLYVNREKRLVVVLNPKVGTTSFRYALTRGYREFLERADPSDGRYPLTKKAREFPFASARDYWHALAHADEYEFYCFVRNPYARLRSAWLNKLAYGHEKGYSKSVKRRILTPVRRFARRHQHPGGTSGEAIPFSTLVSFMESEGPGQRDHHWDEQYSVLFMDVLRYARIYHVETEFNDGQRQIFERVGFDTPCIDDLLTTHRNRSTPPQEPIYDADLARRARVLYARDFEKFGYDTESWQGT